MRVFGYKTKYKELVRLIEKTLERKDLSSEGKLLVICNIMRVESIKEGLGL